MHPESKDSLSLSLNTGSNSPKHQLLTLMKSISQRCRGEEWTEKLEWDLWLSVRGLGNYIYGHDYVTEQENLQLHRLSLQAGGWWSMVDGTPQFFPEKEWVRRYKAGYQNVNRSPES